MRRGFPKTLDRATSHADGWISVGHRNLGSIQGHRAVLLVEAPYADNSGTETWLRVELNAAEAQQLAEWLERAAMGTA